MFCPSVTTRPKEQFCYLHHNNFTQLKYFFITAVWVYVIYYGVIVIKIHILILFVKHKAVCTLRCQFIRYTYS